jgi:hypothetical protein
MDQSTSSIPGSLAGAIAEPSVPSASLSTWMTPDMPDVYSRPPDMSLGGGVSHFIGIETESWKRLVSTSHS